MLLCHGGETEDALTNVDGGGGVFFEEIWMHVLCVGRS